MGNRGLEIPGERRRRLEGSVGPVPEACRSRLLLGCNSRNQSTGQDARKHLPFRTKKGHVSDAPERLSDGTVRPPDAGLGGQSTGTARVVARVQSACSPRRNCLSCNAVPPVSLTSPVCLYSFHPLVLSELERLIADQGATYEAHRLEPGQVSDLSRLPVPPASGYVIEANARGRATEAIVEEILSRFPEARLVVVAEKFEESSAKTF